MTLAKRTTRTDRLKRCPACVIALCAVWSMSPGAQAQTDEGVPRILLNRSLEPQAIELLEIAENGIVYVAQTGLVRSTPFADIAALYTDNTSIVPGPWIELTDGQRFTGSPAGGLESADDLFWDSSAFGLMRISLDDVRLIVLDPEVDISVDLDTQSDVPRDHVVLRNGDVLSGFIEYFGQTIGIDAGSTVVRIELDRLRAVHFANDTTSRQGVFVWLSDGTVANVASLDTTRGTIELTRSLAPAAHNDTEANDLAVRHTFPLSSLVALVPDASTFHPLSSLVLRRHVPSPQRRWTPDAAIGSTHSRPLGTADIEIPGPMRLEWSLPANSRLLSFDAMLPKRSRVWGDCEIIVHALVRGLDVPIARAHLSAENPSESVIASFPADATGLAITLDAGRFGPAQDDVILRNAIVLIER